ncbi:MAG: FAD-dependent oxidoreductase [Gammaproteobacteria bacterium]|nr:FAD-dependent oxidoreductase [Gammaproteobacteria bacterium]
MPTGEQRRYDAAVVGGGLVGTAAALSLAREGRRVALIERQPPKRIAGALGFDPRTVALTPVSRRLLERLGVWSEIPAQPIVAMRVWEQAGTAAVHFDAGSVLEEALAWVVEVGRAAEALWSRCEGIVEVFCPAEVEDIDADAERVMISGPGVRLETDLLIAADGVSSKVCELLHVGVRRRPEHHRAIATVARMEGDHQGVAYQRFGATGPLALLPLDAPNHVSVIWSVADSCAEALMALPATGFAETLQRASERVLGAVIEVDRRAQIRLADMIVDDFNPVQRVLVIGDAAHTIHPLAGQGLNLGLEDIERITDTGVTRADLGAAGTWRRYARGRRARAELMTGLMGLFENAYGIHDPIARWIRNVGVRFIDRTPAIKNQLMREAMGLGPIAQHR